MNLKIFIAILSIISLLTAVGKCPYIIEHNHMHAANTNHDHESHEDHAEAHAPEVEMAESENCSHVCLYSLNFIPTTLKNSSLVDVAEQPVFHTIFVIKPLFITLQEPATSRPHFSISSKFSTVLSPTIVILV